MATTGFKLPKGVDKARPHKRVEPRALLFGETRVLFVRRASARLLALAEGWLSAPSGLAPAI